jgi:hypothetical protein
VRFNPRRYFRFAFFLTAFLGAALFFFAADFFVVGLGLSFTATVDDFAPRFPPKMESQLSEYFLVAPIRMMVTFCSFYIANTHCSVTRIVEGKVVFVKRRRTVSENELP